MNAAFGGDPQDVRSWGRLDLLAPQADAVAAHADGLAEPTAGLMSTLGTLLQMNALFARSELLKRRALALVEASYGKDHPNVTRDLNNLAQLLQATNRLGEANR
jgi:hypothetical protein